MIVVLRAVVLSALLILPATFAAGDEAQDALVAEGVKAFDNADYQKAKDILLPLAHQNIPEAMHYIGRMHGSTPVFPNDPKLKCDWYERAAKLGLGKSMYNYSLCYGFIDGREKSREQELYWLTKAAEHGSIRAMINLAAEDETFGEEYRRWMNKAAQQGNIFAKVRLWMKDYKQDVPDIRIQDITCTYIRILIFDEDIYACDDLP